MDKSEQNQIADLLGQAPARISEFKKETYETSFQKYLEDNMRVWSMLADIWCGNTPDGAQDMLQVAECLADRAQEQIDSTKGRAQRNNAQLNINLYMVSYFLPALIAYQRRCGGGEEEMHKLTDAICDKWQERFGQRIQAADHESIQAGFKQKLCFVTTAVCCGLHKPQDCREITLMKRYRDEYMFRQADGEMLVREYYDIAPTIVKRIAKEASPEEKYWYLWEHYISRCVALVEAGQNEQCKRLYTEMMTELKAEYMVTDRRERKGQYIA
ncbi:MAG: hypothetical protein NC416_10100 [Eubacterium sp.]|nr:hypothetical protein [Eubacterium sp.]